MYCMKKYILAIIFSLISSLVFSQGEIFETKKILNPNTPSGRFRHPFAMVMGPDDSLWVTERRGYVMKVSTLNGGKHQLLNISSLVRFTVSGTSISQDGMFGIALHPELNTGKGNDYVYLAYCYDSSGFRRVKIVRYQYNQNVPSLSNPLVIMNGIPGSNDHNGGKLMIGNYGTVLAPDYKLLYTVGDRGANQFGNACDSIEAQYTPTNAQMTAGDKRRYNGKILRMELNGAIPADNPLFNAVRSHIFSKGHRNPQGLAFERDVFNNLIPNGLLYESEQGPATNDEVNLISSGKNYGWPRVAGVQDDVWYKYFKWAGTGSCSSYPGECSSTQTTLGLKESSFSDVNYQDPIFDMYAATPVGGTNCNWLTNPTLAPSSIIYYPHVQIPGWKNSLLITTLKASAVYLLKLNDDGSKSNGSNDSLVELFKDPNALNRYRDIAFSKDGLTFYMLTDSVGATSGPSAGQNGGITDRGCILSFKYAGSLLSLPENPNAPASAEYSFQFYPNPAREILFIESKTNTYKPLYYELHDMAGKLILRGTSRTEKIEIPVGKFARGMYFIKLYNGRNILMKQAKIILQ